MFSGRITCDESLFWYPNINVDCTDYQDTDFVPIFEVDFAGDAAFEAKADEVCGPVGESSATARQSCIFDYFVTQDEALAQNSLETVSVNADLQANLRKLAVSLITMATFSTYYLQVSWTVTHNIKSIAVF